MQIKAKKSLGQNFLKNNKILDKIIKAGDIKKGELILEVGPGKGALTKKLLDAGAKVFAIEKDHRLIDFLNEKFAEEAKSGQLKILEEDILNFDLESHGFKKQNFKIIANLPYYITGIFMQTFLENNIHPSDIVLLLQKEVVLRITGEKNKEQKENILSLSVKVFGEPKYITGVKASNFNPAPKVDSAVLKISNISKDFFAKDKINQKDFFAFLKLAFSEKRKMLAKNLSKENNREKVESILDNLNINKKTRAENLKLKDFKKIFKNLDGQ